MATFLHQQNAHEGHRTLWREILTICTHLSYMHRAPHKAKYPGEGRTLSFTGKTHPESDQPGQSQQTARCYTRVTNLHFTWQAPGLRDKELVTADTNGSHPIITFKRNLKQEQASSISTPSARLQPMAGSLAGPNLSLGLEGSSSPKGWLQLQPLKPVAFGTILACHLT